MTAVREYERWGLSLGLVPTVLPLPQVDSWIYAPSVSVNSIIIHHSHTPSSPLLHPTWTPLPFRRGLYKLYPSTKAKCTGAFWDHSSYDYTSPETTGGWRLGLTREQPIRCVVNHKSCSRQNNPHFSVQFKTCVRKNKLQGNVSAFRVVKVAYWRWYLYQSMLVAHSKAIFFISDASVAHKSNHT